MKVRHRNNTIAGFFVLATIVLFVVLAWILSDIQTLLGGTRDYGIRFPLDVGIHGLETGAGVTIAGYDIGRVTGIEPVLDPGDGEEPHILVTVTVGDEYVLCQGAEPGLVMPLIGGISSIDFVSLGNGAGLADGEDLIGMYAPSVMLESAGIGEEQVEHLQGLLANAKDISQEWKSTSESLGLQLRTHGPDLIESVQDLVKRIQQISSDLSEQWPSWRDYVGDSLANVKTASDKAPELMDKATQTADNVDATVTDVKGFIAEVKPSVRATIANAEAISDEVRNQWLQEVETLFTKAHDGMDSATSTLEQIDNHLTIDLPQLSRILGNMRIGSDNLKLAMIEIRQDPWRLLQEPDEKAMQESLVYDSVRTYANAVSDLNASIASLQALHDRYGNSLGSETKSLDRVLQQLNDDYTRYQDAERQWFDLMTTAQHDGDQ